MDQDEDEDDTDEDDKEYDGKRIDFGVDNLERFPLVSLTLKIGFSRRQ